MYSEKALSTFLEFRNTGIIKGADATSKVVNKECGDIFKLFARVENGVITEAKFQAFGSVLVFASLSSAVDLITRKNAEEIRKISLQDLLRKLDQFPKSKLYILKNTIEVIGKLADEIAPIEIPKKKRKNQLDLKMEMSEIAEISEPVKITEKVVKSDKAEKLTAEKVREILETSPVIKKEKPSVKREIKTEISVTEVVSTGQQTKNDSKNAAAETEDFGMLDEIDSITARLSEAISKLKTDK